MYSYSTLSHITSLINPSLELCLPLLPFFIFLPAMISSFSVLFLSLGIKVTSSVLLMDSKPREHGNRVPLQRGGPLLWTSFLSFILVNLVVCILTFGSPWVSFYRVSKDHMEFQEYNFSHWVRVKYFALYTFGPSLYLSFIIHEWLLCSMLRLRDDKYYMILSLYATFLIF